MFFPKMFSTCFKMFTSSVDGAVSPPNAPFSCEYAFRCRYSCESLTAGESLRPLQLFNEVSSDVHEHIFDCCPNLKVCRFDDLQWKARCFCRDFVLLHRRRSLPASFTGERGQTAQHDVVVACTVGYRNRTCNETFQEIYLFYFKM